MAKGAQFTNRFGVIALTSNELATLSRQQRGFLIASSFIVNDIRFFWSLMVRSPIDSKGDLGSLQMVRWLWCTRKLASVVYESVETLSRLGGQLPQAINNSPILTKSLRKSRCFNIARALRNKSVYHYDIDDLDGSLPTFDTNAQHRYFANPQQGNSINEIGEQIYTMPLISENGTVTHSEFDDWCRQASNQIMSFCDKTLADILLEAFPKKSYLEMPLAIETETAPPNQRWSLFLKV